MLQALIIDAAPLRPAIIGETQISGHHHGLITVDTGGIAITTPTRTARSSVIDCSIFSVGSTCNAVTAADSPRPEPGAPLHHDPDTTTGCRYSRTIGFVSFELCVPHCHVHLAYRVLIHLRTVNLNPIALTASGINLGRVEHTSHLPIRFGDGDVSSHLPPKVR